MTSWSSPPSGSITHIQRQCRSTASGGYRYRSCVFSCFRKCSAKSARHHLSVAASSIRNSGCSNHQETVLGEAAVPGTDRIYLTVTASEEGYHFYYDFDDQTLIPLCLRVDPTLLSSIVNEGFTGTYIGMYTSSNKTESENYADYDWVIYEGVN